MFSSKLETQWFKEFNFQWALEFFSNFKGNNFSSLGIAPASLYIDHLKSVFADYDVKIGCQNIDFQETGARTGEISRLNDKRSGM